MKGFVRVLWWLFAGSVGGPTREDILRALRQRPRNAQQLAEAVGRDYTTVRHHLRVLMKNGLLVAEGERYGRMYFLSEAMSEHWGDLEGILEQMRGKRGGAEHAAT